jgi:putative hydrolase of the HAD superfamily
MTAKVPDSVHWVACDLQPSSHQGPTVRTPSIRAVTIDLWGTLFLDGPLADDRYRRQRLLRIGEVLAARDIEVPPPSLVRGYEASRQHLARVWRTRQDVPVESHVTALLHAIDPTLPPRLGASDLAALAWAYASPALDAPPSCDPGAGTAIKTLVARGIAVCLVSNTMRTPGAVLRQIIANAGLLELFSSMVFSDECGIRKPDARIFHRALRNVGVAPRHAVHVGDDARLDIEGAHLANLRAIRVGGSRAGDPSPDVSIQGLSELPAAVEWLEAVHAPDWRLHPILVDHASRQ